MPTRLVFGSLVVLAACSDPPHDGHATGDGGAVLTDGADPDGGVDPLDAQADAPELDTTPPMLVDVTPGAGEAVWLHAPIRLSFDEALSPPTNLTVTAALAGSAVPAELAFEPPRTLAITLPAPARGVGTLEIHLAGSITDLAGNAHTDPIDLGFVVPPWSRTTTDRGVAATAPELAVTAGGDVWAAWLVGGAGARRVAVSALMGNTWFDAGGTLGTGDVTSVSIAIDQDGAPLVAWSEAGVAHVARWAAATWTELPSPGAADHVAIATPPTGAAMVALIGATAGVRELAGTTWLPIGADITVGSAIASPSALAALADGRPAIGWIDAQNALRVYRYDASWTALAPLPASAGSRMSLAGRAGSLVVAWDHRAGSSGVLVAQASGAATTWTRLGRALDIDVFGDAIAPAIALDASGAPIVAWTELVETSQRGAIARWTGTRWSIVGGISWLDTPQATPTRTRIALHAGEAAVVATSTAGAIRVARLNGPRVAATGIPARMSRAGCAFDAANPPALLSQTGCFDLSVANRPVPHPGLVPYDLVSELWSDGAKKRRYLGLPDGAGMTLGGNGAWVAPVGTLIIKQFDLETTSGDPSTRRPVETRFLVNDASLGWQGFTYRWNTAGTNASLLPDGAFTVDWPVDGSQHAHLYPSRAHCRSCHHPSTGPLLGVRSEQLARWFDYDGVIADQLGTLSALGIAPVASAQPLVSPHDPGETVERRMRGYMAGNCQHCHNPQYLNVLDLRHTTALAQTRLCNVITPGAPASSRVFQLVTSRPGMPALGSLAVDPLAAQLLGAWITGMSSCP